MIEAVVVLSLIGGLLGLGLGIADNKLQIQTDERYDVVLKMLPGVNCGGCGYPGCPGFAQGIVDGDVKKVSACVVANAETKAKIKDYVNSTPGVDGSVLKVDI